METEEIVKAPGSSIIVSLQNSANRGDQYAEAVLSELIIKPEMATMLEMVFSGKGAVPEDAKQWFLQEKNRRNVSAFITSLIQLAQECLNDPQYDHVLYNRLLNMGNAINELVKTEPDRLAQAFMEGVRAREQQEARKGLTSVLSLERVKQDERLLSATQ